MVTIRFKVALFTASLVAYTLAVPVPTAVSTAVAPLAWMEITRPLLVLQETTRPVSGVSVWSSGVAVSVKVSPRLRLSVLLRGAPANVTDATACRTTGGLPGKYSKAPNSNVCWWAPVEATRSTSEVGRPRNPPGPPWARYKSYIGSSTQNTLALFVPDVMV